GVACEVGFELVVVAYDSAQRISAIFGIIEKGGNSLQISNRIQPLQIIPKRRLCHLPRQLPLLQLRLQLPEKFRPVIPVTPLKEILRSLKNLPPRTRDPETL